MAIERFFLGWDRPLTGLVSDMLLPDRDDLADLSHLLVVVPTRQAGRRLREAMARRRAHLGTGLLPPLVETPSFFIRAARPVPEIAPGAVVRLAWVHVLIHAKLDAFPALFPGAPPIQDFDWAVGMADLMDGLRRQLADGGWLLRDVVERCKRTLPEPERWWDLQRLEQRYEERLEKLGYVDPCRAMIASAEAFEVPDGIERIVVAAVPDPALLMVRALEKTSRPVHILIQAPDAYADHFDGWGRPRPEVWAQEQIPVFEPARNLSLIGSPFSQGRKVLQLLQEEAYGPGDVAVGVPDAQVTPFIMANLREQGVHTFDPAGKALTTHPLYQLLDAFSALVHRADYHAAARFFRHADVLALLYEEHGVSPLDLLKELDRFQNDYLPTSWHDVARRFPSERSPALDKAVALAKERIAAFRSASLDEAVRDLMQRVYAQHHLIPHRPEDEEFRKAVNQLLAVLDEFSPEAVTTLGISREEALQLFVRRLAQERYYPEKPDAGLDLEGWLELAWNDAPLLIVTGMNEGCVPDGHIGDMFLPDTLRERLGLRHDEDRLARDAYLTRALIESRASNGRVCFLVGKTGANGDPLKPSRLLFRCTDEELPERARQLFGDAEELRDNVPASVSFPLDAEAPLAEVGRETGMQVLHVTAFRQYLACPFRFYLAYALGMKPLSDDQTELEAPDFGTLIHRALEQMARDQAIRTSTEADRVTDFLWNALQEVIDRRFGTVLALPVALQVESARQRLRAAAQEQVRLVRDGWEILHAEHKFEVPMGGLSIHGKVDRIDRHREDGRVRLLDYKSSDTASSPVDVHIGPPAGGPDYAEVSVQGKPKRWIDLQLPLYRLLLKAEGTVDGPVELGYFNLPKAVNETGVSIWEDFTDEMDASAQNCAAGVVADVTSGKFWPPAERVKHDDFADLFHGPATEAFQAFSWAARPGGTG